MDYQFQTTFWEDFTVAEYFGIKAVEDTYERAFGEWKRNYIYLTELVIVLNWKCWEAYHNNKDNLSELYTNYYYITRDYALKHLKGDELTYFIRTTD